MSLLIQERGLKCRLLLVVQVLYQSLLIQERGLKFAICLYSQSALRVAPYTGAWIEILFFNCVFDSSHVAPYTGAWIEMIIQCCCICSFVCRSLYRSVD